jgi:hypothetical protein
MQLWTILPGDFTPTEEEILRVEAALPSVLAEIGPSLLPKHRPYDAFWERLDDYRRQYAGVMRLGMRLVVGNIVSAGFCEHADWRTKPVLVDDGGYGVLAVTFDLGSGMFLDVTSNGYA